MRRTKPKANAATLTVEELLAPFSPAVRDLVGRLRRVLHQGVPAFTERVLPGWKAIGFREPEAGHVCAVFPLPDEVKLYFEHGAELEDEDGVLEGAGKQTRYITIRSRRDIDERAITRLARQAVVRRATR